MKHKYRNRKNNMQQRDIVAPTGRTVKNDYAKCNAKEEKACIEIVFAARPPGTKTRR